MKNLRNILLAMIASLTLLISGCRTINYSVTETAGGVTTTKKFKYGVLGFDTKLGGLNLETQGHNKKLELQDLDTNSQNAIGVIGKLVDRVPSYGGGSTTIVTPAIPSPTVLPVPRPVTTPVPPPVSAPATQPETRLPPRRPAPITAPVRPTTNPIR